MSEGAAGHKIIRCDSGVRSGSSRRAKSTLFVSSLACGRPARRAPECRQMVCTCSLKQTNRYATHPKDRHGGLSAGSRLAPAIHADGGNVGDHGIRPERLSLVRLAPISSPLSPTVPMSRISNIHDQVPKSSAGFGGVHSARAMCLRLIVPQAAANGCGK